MYDGLCFFRSRSLLRAGGALYCAPCDLLTPPPPPSASSQSLRVCLRGARRNAGGDRGMVHDARVRLFGGSGSQELGRNGKKQEAPQAPPSIGYEASVHDRPIIIPGTTDCPISRGDQRPTFSSPLPSKACIDPLPSVCPSVWPLSS